MSFAVAIDGPAGAGKSTAAKQLSAMLGAIYLDTGAMYRTVALAAINRGINTKNEKELQQMLETIDIDVRFGKNGQEIYLNGENVNGKIRTPEVSLAASEVAIFPPVRRKMVEKQRGIASRSNVVMDGRDIGTYVLKDAQYKFFLVATVEIRARRRFNEMTSKGVEADYEKIKKDIEFRDKNDSSRTMAPLRQAEDAILIDTSEQTIQEMVDEMAGYINAT